MKALEILKEGLDFMEKAIETNPLSKEELESEIKVYQEAKKELEAIQDIILEKDEALEVERFLHKQKIEALMEKDKMKNCEDCYNKTNLAFKALENRSCENCNMTTLPQYVYQEICNTCSNNFTNNWKPKIKK